MIFEVKFEGGLAEFHKIPAYDGTKSLEGLTRSLMIVSTYLVEGRVRRKNFGQVPLHFHLTAHRPGSFDVLYEIAYTAAVYGGPVLAGGVASNLLTDLLKTIFRRVTGADADQETPETVQHLEAERGGDVAALAEAIEPSVRLAHNVINHGVVNININQNAAPPAAPLVQLNAETKRYVWENVINDEIRVRLFSVGSFNANQGTGRAFDLELGRSIPFELANNVDRITVDTLLQSISSYTRTRRLGDDLRSAIAIRYTSVDSVDGRLKKIRILSARNEMRDL
ncbi:hypothetical protein [Stappia sp. P2PMeth1]|uniref:DUF7946 domain-containing protein n=1 Tax=Stappia sp. P2PMeth1 TaxID=2003586 RepID=UPI0016449584|nr:hypothetical protein [Stappia sp. P2PMeth1]